MHRWLNGDGRPCVRSTLPTLCGMMGTGEGTQNPTTLTFRAVII